MRFEGTHFPGQHTTIVPIPQQIMVPERKIIGPAEAEKWHASRGSGVAADEGGGTPILLPDLVGGWALTAGPQQTLSSAGMIASGPLDLTEIGGPLTYGANGVSLNGTSQALYVADSAALDCGNQPLAITYDASCTNLASSPEGIAKGGYFGGQDYGVNNQGDISNKFQFFGNEIAIALLPAAPASGQRYSVLGGFDPSGIGTFVQVDGGAVYVTSPSTGGTSNSEALTIGVLGVPPDSSENYFAGNIRRIRLWIGATAALIANSATIQTWLYNGGAGRTDAEIAAYTG